MIVGCICGFMVCASDVFIVLMNGGKKFKIASAVALCSAGKFYY